MTDGVAVLEDGEKLMFSLTYEQFKKVFLEGKINGVAIREIEIHSKHSDKGPNRIRFA